MLMNPTHTTPKIDAADAATVATRGQGFELELLPGSVIALGARCAQ